MIGRGGMGVEYRAEQESLGRKVALKVLPSSALNTTEHVLRFKREAQAAARLHHTDIAPVYGVGEDRGIHRSPDHHPESHCSRARAPLSNGRHLGPRSQAIPGRQADHDLVVFDASFCPDGTRIVTASWDGTARIWDAKTGQQQIVPLKHDGIVRTAV